MPFQINVSVDVKVGIRKDRFFFSPALIGILRNGKYFSILGNQSIES